MNARKALAAAIVVAGTISLAAGPASSGEPTCSSTLGIANHGQHIVGDYVTGIGHTELGWSPAGQVGAAIAGKGAVLPGGPGPAFHFPNDVAPGASFCTGSKSPGAHL